MFKQLLDVDPLSNTQTWHHYDPDTDTTYIQEIQDVEPYLKLAKSLRNDDDVTKEGIKRGLWKYAIIPQAIQVELLRRGIDIYNKQQWKEVIKIINQEYPGLKTTRGRHG